MSWIANPCSFCTRTSMAETGPPRRSCISSRSLLRSAWMGYEHRFFSWHSKDPQRPWSCLEELNPTLDPDANSGFFPEIVKSNVIIEKKGYSAWWQATLAPDNFFSGTGTSFLQRSVAIGHLGWKEHPGGIRIGEGGSRLPAGRVGESFILFWVNEGAVSRSNFV